MHLESNSATSDIDKASLFNIFFESFYSKQRYQHNLRAVPTLPRQETNLDLINITEEEVYKAFTSLDTTKACGADSIGPKLLRSCALALFPVIHHLFIICLWYCDIPRNYTV